MIIYQIKRQSRRYINIFLLHPCRLIHSTNFYKFKLPDFTLSELKTLDGKQVDSAEASSKRIFLNYNDIRKSKKRNKKLKSNLVQSDVSEQQQPNNEFITLMKDINNESKLDQTNELEHSDDLIKSVEFYKPIESSMSKKRFNSLVSSINSSFTKNQLTSYLALKNITEESSKKSKKDLVNVILLNCWNISKSSSLTINDLYDNLVIQLQPWEYKVILKSKKFHTLLKKNNQVKYHLSNENFQIALSGSNRKLSSIQNEILLLKSSIKNERIDLNPILAENDKLHQTLDLTQIEYYSNCHFEKLPLMNEYIIYANTTKSLQKAKRLILWTLAFNSHKEEVFNIEKLQGSTLQPYVTDDLSWNEKNHQYYKIFKNDLQPNKSSDLIFDKFDKLSNREINQSNTNLDLIDYRFKLDIQDENIGNEVTEENADDFMNLFEKLGLKEEEVDKDKDFDLYKLVQHKQSANGQELKDESLNDLRTQLGLFEDVNTNEFPDVAKLCEDIESKSQDEQLNDLRTQLFNQSTFEVPESNEYFTDSEIDQLYSKFPNDSNSNNQTSTFTIQFGSIVVQNQNKPSKTFDKIPLINENSKFKFINDAPFMSDLATSLQCDNNDPPYKNKLQMRLYPSLNQIETSHGLTYPSIEIQVEFTENRKVDYSTLQLSKINSIHNQTIFLPDKLSDLQITKSTIEPINITQQPNLDDFFEKFKLSLGKFEIPVSELTLLIDGKEVSYSVINLLFKTEILFKFNDRIVLLNIINGGEFVGKKIELFIGEEGNLSRDEFKHLLNDTFQFLKLINV